MQDPKSLYLFERGQLLVDAADDLLNLSQHDGRFMQRLGRILGAFNRLGYGRLKGEEGDEVREALAPGAGGLCGFGLSV